MLFATVPDEFMLAIPLKLTATASTTVQVAAELCVAGRLRLKPRHAVPAIGAIGSRPCTHKWTNVR